MSQAVVRVGGYAPPGSTHSKAIEYFAAEMHDLFGNTVDVDLLHNVLDLGHPASELLDMVTKGDLTWCYFSTAYLGPKVSELNAIEIPFLFDDLDEAHAALDGPLGDALSAATLQKAGYEVLGYWDNGFRHLTNAVRDVRTPEDAAGMRIRLQPNPIHEAMVEAWGMTPARAELSVGIQMIKDGEVDAQENPLANSAAYGVTHEYVTLTGHLYGARGLYANPEVMAGYPEDIAFEIRKVAKRAIDFQREAAAAYEDELAERFRNEGRTVRVLSVEERAAFRDPAADLIARLRTETPEHIRELLP